MKFDEALQACADQGAVVATYDQLFEAWKDGLDWCNAGWLSDGTVRYPIKNPREPCGGANNGPGLRSYGHQDREKQFDAFCFATALKGEFFKNLFMFSWFIFFIILTITLQYLGKNCYVWTSLVYKHVKITHHCLNPSNRKL